MHCVKLKTLSITPVFRPVCISRLPIGSSSAYLHSTPLDSGLWRYVIVPPSEAGLESISLNAPIGHTYFVYERVNLCTRPISAHRTVDFDFRTYDSRGYRLRQLSITISHELLPTGRDKSLTLNRQTTSNCRHGAGVGFACEGARRGCRSMVKR